MEKIAPYAKAITHAAVNRNPQVITAGLVHIGCSREHAEFIAHNLVRISSMDGKKAAAGLICTLELEGKVANYLESIDNNRADFLERGKYGSAMSMGVFFQVNLLDQVDFPSPLYTPSRCLDEPTAEPAKVKTGKAVV